MREINNKNKEKKFATSKEAKVNFSISFLSSSGRSSKPGVSITWKRKKRELSTMCPIVTPLCRYNVCVCVCVCVCVKICVKYIKEDKLVY